MAEFSRLLRGVPKHLGKVHNRFREVLELLGEVLELLGEVLELLGEF